MIPEDLTIKGYKEAKMVFKNGKEIVAIIKENEIFVNEHACYQTHETFTNFGIWDFNTMPKGTIKEDKAIFTANDALNVLFVAFKNPPMEQLILAHKDILKYKIAVSFKLN